MPPPRENCLLSLEKPVSECSIGEMVAVYCEDGMEHIRRVCVDQMLSRNLMCIGPCIILIIEDSVCYHIGRLVLELLLVAS